MAKKEKGYISLLLLILIAFGVLLTGQFSSIEKQTADTTKYVLVDDPTGTQNKTLQLQNLSFTQAGCDPGTYSYNEPNILWAAIPGPNQAASANDKIKLFYSDEHALALGQATVANPVSAMTPNQPNDHVAPPAVGDQSARDSRGLPFYPALFITDITSDSSNKSGDVENNGTGRPPSEIYGSWKATGADDPKDSKGKYMQNCPNFPACSLGGPDIVPASQTIGLQPSPPPGSKFKGSEPGFGAEIIWNVTDLGLSQGHSYRAQFIVHDGDQTAGGDVGIGCTTIHL